MQLRNPVFLLAFIAANAAAGDGGELRCESRDNSRQTCAANIGGATVELALQHSSAACVHGRSWGYTRDHVWVDQGCRADFVIVRAAYPTLEALQARADEELSCESRDNRRKTCRANVGGGRVEMTLKHSSAACEFGTGWGYERDHIWVDRGCRADFGIYRSYFAPPTVAGAAPQADEQVRCESHNSQRQRCAANVGGNTVDIAFQRSDAACEFGTGWGYGRDHIWVDRGCRADFGIYRQYRTTHRYVAAPVTGGDAQVLCESHGNRRKQCSANIGGGGTVEMTEQLSSSGCRFGESWGYGPDHVWVDRGCRARFGVRHTQSGGQPRLVSVCESDGGKKKECVVNVGGGRVELMRQFSDAACQFGLSWGYGHDRVWVAQGCRGEFGIYR